MLAATDLPLTGRGRLQVATTLRVDGTDHAWAAGDAAAVPDLTSDTPGAICAPNAQHAVRQAKVLADNVSPHCAASPSRSTVTHTSAPSPRSGCTRASPISTAAGSRATRPGSCTVCSTSAGSPPFNRKARVLADWTLAGLFTREIVSLGSLEHPRAEFRFAAGGDRHPDA